MYEELLKYVHSIKNSYLNKLLVKFFEEDEEFIKTFKGNSAAKTVHHGFIGGLLEHTLGVVRLCQYYSKAYPVLNRDLLITAAMLHDIGKTVELSAKIATRIIRTARIRKKVNCLFCAKKFFFFIFSYSFNLILGSI